MRKLILSLTIVALGCGTTTGDGKPSERRQDTTGDGLVRVETNKPGDLYLRDNHGIGGYDAIAIAPAFVNYRRSSTKLEPDVEDAHLAALEQALFDAAEDANVEIEYAAGNCVITVGIGFMNVMLAKSDRADVLAEMTLVIQYQDSVSGEALLRYIAPTRVEHEPEGVSREDQIRASFDRMIAEVDIITALRAATTSPSPPRAGCQGNLLKAGLPIVQTE